MATALFLLDAALDAVMLAMAAHLGGRRPERLRLLAGALLGAGIAWAARRLALSRAQTAVLWLPAAMAMSAAVLGRDALCHPLRHAALMLGAAGLLGGTVLSLYGATGSLPTAYALGGVCMAAMTACMTRTRAQAVKKVEIACRYQGRTVRFEAMVDSGNTLRDYLTGWPVIVMPEAVGRRLFSPADGALRPIFADTAGGRQMMRLLAPQQMQIIVQGERRRTAAAVALCAALEESAPALVPAALIDQADTIQGIKSRGGSGIWNKREA